MAISVSNASTYSSVQLASAENFELFGTYSGEETSEFQFRITEISTLKFIWVQHKQSGEGSWSSEVTASASTPTALADGISVTMSQANNYWSIGDRISITFDKSKRTFNDIQVINPDEGDTVIVGWSSIGGVFVSTKDNGLNEANVLGNATSSRNKITSVSHNDSLLYGFGSDNQSIPKRIGYQRYRQFNEEFKPNELFVENSVTNLPDNFTAPYDAEEITVKYYADASSSAGNNHKLLCLIEKNTPFMHLLYDDGTNYKFHKTENLNDYDIVNPISMTTDGLNIYILDNVNNGIIRVLRPKKDVDNATNYNTTFTYAFYNLPWNGYLTEGAFYSDILINKSAEDNWESKLWIAIHKPYKKGDFAYKDGDNSLVYTADITNARGHYVKNLLASIDVVSATNKVILTSRMPSVTNWFSKPTSGDYQLVDNIGTNGTNRIVQTYEKSLIRMGDTANTVGWICNYARKSTWLDDRLMIMEEAKAVFADKSLHQSNGGNISVGNEFADYRIEANLIVNVLTDQSTHAQARLKLPIKAQTDDIEYLKVNNIFYSKDSSNNKRLWVFDENEIRGSADLSDIGFDKEYILEALWTGVDTSNIENFSAFYTNDKLTGSWTEAPVVASGTNHNLEHTSNGLMNFAVWRASGAKPPQLEFKYGFKSEFRSSFENSYLATDTMVNTSNTINSTAYSNQILAMQMGSSNVTFVGLGSGPSPKSVEVNTINADLAQTVITGAMVSNDDEGAFSGGGEIVADSDVVYYAYSYTYDGYQETQLSGVSASVKNVTAGAGITGHENFDVQVTVDILSTRPLSKRISHINIYRSHNKDAAESTEPDEYFRLLKSIELKSSLFSIGGDYWRYQFTDKGKSGPTYEAITGIPETLENLQPHYTLSTVGNGSMFIANCWHYNLGSVPTYIFKSKVNRYNIYDWTSDFVILPEVPKEIAFWAGKLFAFSENKTYQINPDTLSIEDVLEGTGGISSVVTDYGMFFCDNYTIYHHDGSRINNIGSIINSINEPTSFNNRDLSFIPKMAFDARRKVLCVVFKVNNSLLYYAWAYSINAKRWDLWQIGAIGDAPIALTSDQRGEILYSTQSGGLYKYLGGASKRNWQWISKYITLGQDTIDKTFWKIRLISEGLISTFYSIDNTNTVSLSNEKLASGSKNKGIKLKITGSEGTTDPKVDSIGLIYRRRPIK